MKGVKLGEWYPGVSVSMPSFFIQTAYMNFNEVRLEPVYEGQQRASKPVIFGSDQQGIYSLESGDWISYRDVVLVELDGKRVTRLTAIDREAFAGCGVIYPREKPFCHSI